MYNIYYGFAPSYLCDIRLISSIHGHFKRYSYKSFELGHCKAQGKKTFQYNGAKEWNDLPKYLKEITNKDMFKRKCKSHMFQEMFRREADEFTQ